MALVPYSLCELYPPHACLGFSKNLTGNNIKCTKQPNLREMFTFSNVMIFSNDHDVYILVKEDKKKLHTRPRQMPDGATGRDGESVLKEDGARGGAGFHGAGRGTSREVNCKVGSEHSKEGN